MLKLVDFLIKRKIFFFTLLLLVSAILINGVTRIRLSEDIFSALPKGKAFENFNFFIENKNISSQVVFSIDLADDSDAAELAEIYSDSIKNVAGAYLTKVKATRPNVEEQVYDYLYSNFP